jgi:RNA recognition motif-containing protein
MEEGTKTKKTIFVGGIKEDVDEAVVLETFAPFGMSRTLSFRWRCADVDASSGDVIEVQLPTALVHTRPGHEPTGAPTRLSNRVC